ncbi:rubredoxin [Campylobacter anatolicus]|uniref:rubredoxin n=1 Tax=Campylobacter anatolicus TaxID=2829105 RepID=UPI003B84A4FA
MYLSTHTPLGYENLEAKKIVDLDNPPKNEFIKNADFVYDAPTDRYICSVCGYIYDPKLGDPEHGIAPGTKFEDLPDEWHCPNCGSGQDKFSKA